MMGSLIEELHETGRPRHLPNRLENSKVRGLWVDQNEFTLPRFVLFRAVRALSKTAPGSLDALALIRAAFATDDGWCSLADARVLLELIRTDRA